ncbi:queuosine salvage protein-like isoform X2 [Paramacrobiotus metropolitanus]|uniref:queuosine salvage protein-like isoform X2 n=1 Tax=Paramacrobiotus metropolitanus TaxID=2943436 RepID=UPI002445F7A8|nr:queuosine salvage protein-like isoform X2 [Paramacrobiotus metropolitanus]
MNCTRKQQTRKRSIGVYRIFFVDTLNFSFWSEDESDQKFCVEYNGKRWTGYWALCAAVNRALDEGIPITDPKYYEAVTDQQLEYVFRTSTHGVMPMIQERKQNLHDAAKTLISKFDGTFATCIKKAAHSAKELLNIIVNDFPSYRDESIFEGRTVYFYKRAQILVADLWACFEGKDLLNFADIDHLTIFPDYRVPQVLNYFKTMVYSPTLENKLRKNYLFHYGEKEELEIRGSSVWVVELLWKEISDIMGKDAVGSVNAIVLDHYLWDYRQAHNDDMKDVPFHKIRCIYY